MQSFCPLWFAGLFLLWQPHTHGSESQKVFTCCSHENTDVTPTKPKIKPTDKHDACNGDMCKCVSCHLSLVYLPLFQGQPSLKMFRSPQYQIPLPLIVCTAMIFQGLCSNHPDLSDCNSGYLISSSLFTVGDGFLLIQISKRE